MGNLLAIVGRPNVGKSTFFNRLTGMRQAIVHESSGVTRDRHYGRSEWNGIEFSVIDTGGYITGSDDIFEGEIRRQAELAIEEADAIVFMVDIRAGVTPMDQDVADLLRKSKKNVFLVANKADNPNLMSLVGEFYSLGLGEVYPISSINGSGTGELLDDVVKDFSTESEPEELDLPKITIVGRPNVGKSSLLNALLGTDRNIVTSIAGTTRDTVFTRYNNFGFDFLLVDTAGIRKKKNVHEDIEFYSVMRSVRAIEYSDVCILMIDATEGFESQDMNILHLIDKNHKGLVVVVNKWDLVEKGTNTHKEFEELIRVKTAPFTDYPIIFTSVINKQRIFKTVEIALEVFKNKTQRISTSQLNEVILPIVKENPPPIVKDKRINVKYITQLKTHYPAFVFFCNLPQYVKDPYKRFVENRLRKLYNFKGVPIEIYFREK